MNVVNIFTLLLLPCVIWTFPSSDSATESLLVHSKGTVTQNNDDASEDSKNESLPPQLKSLNITSHIRNRYARTVVTSRYANPQSKAQEATFSIVLPNTAFISGFIMEIKGQQYKAYVREKEEAKREYQAAVREGHAAAHVAVSARDSNTFSVSMNVEPHSKVTFILTYEELLVRKHGKYELVVNLNPGQFVKELDVDVYIQEMRQILSVDTPALRSGNEIQDSSKVTKNEFATVETLDTESKNVHVKFSPSKEQQKEMAKQLYKKDEANSLAGQFTVVYDVERDPQGGEVLISDGYFVHFFAPSDLKPIPKHVIFVLDVSGSMSGRKLNQLKQAMKTILGELSEEDFFDIIKFSTAVQVLHANNTWIEARNPSNYEHTSTHAATSERISEAQQVIENLHYEGWTNIYDALQIALKVSAIREMGVNNVNNPQPIIIFLTDGQANVGESRSEEIIKSVTSQNKKAALFTLGFGYDVDKDLLKGLAIKNHGFMRNIYEAADAALQLEDFYKQISSPLLTDVKFQYADEQTASVTKPTFPFMFRGSELVVAGKIKTPTDSFVNVEGKTRNGTNIFRPRIYPILVAENKEYGSLERLWAYLTIKQLLDTKYERPRETNDSTADLPEKQALDLALKYSFVTPVTSLVVVKPNVSESVNAEEARPKENSHSYLSRGRSRSSTAHRSFISSPGSSRKFYQSPLLTSSLHNLRSSSAPAGMPGVPLIVGGSTRFETLQKPVQEPINVCSPSPCGPSSSCREINGIPVCSCLPNYIGSPPNCRPECTTVSECPNQHVCINQKCNGSGDSIDFRIYGGDDKISSKNETILDHLPWLAAYISNEILTIDNKDYAIGNNQTSVEQKACQVESLGYSGNCTLLSACPRVYPNLDSLETFKKYFCTLSTRYAGVCCIDPASI